MGHGGTHPCPPGPAEGTNSSQYLVMARGTDIRSIAISDRPANDREAVNSDNGGHKMQILVAAMPAILLVGCSQSAPIEDKGAGIANPASEHCVKMGGKVEIRKEASGEVGYCHLPDGRIVEEWKLFHSSTDDRAKP